MKKLALLIAFGVMLYVALSHMTPILGFVGYILRLVTPFLLGLCIAFILNVPMRFIENLLFGPPVEGVKGLKAKIRRPVSVILTLLIVCGIIAVVMFLVNVSGLITLLRQSKTAVAETETMEARISAERKITIANEFEF